MSNASSDPGPPKAPSRQTPPAEPKSITVFITVLTGALIYALPLFLTVAVLQVVFVILRAGGYSQLRAEHLLTNTTFAQFLYVLITEFFVMLMIVAFLRITKETWKSIGVKRPKLNHGVYTLAGLAVYFGVYIVAATALSGVLNFNQKQELGFDTQVKGINMILIFFSLVILPPLVEEITFRGFLYTRFKRALSVKVAAVAVSLLFAAGHLQVFSGNPLLWTAALDTFILSLVLVYVREKTGTIWAGAGIHALKNLIAFSILFIHF